MTFQKCECAYCQRLAGFYMHSFLLGEERVYWFDIPKNASTSVKSKFALDDDTLVSRREFPALAAQGIKPIVIYRNPINRFVSLLNHYLYPSGPYGRFNRGEALFRSQGININNLSPEERVEVMFDSLGKLTTFHLVHHWYPQVKWIDRNTFSEFRMIRMRNASRVLGIGNENPSAHIINNDMLTNAQITTIENIYSDDYDFLGDLL